MVIGPTPTWSDTMINPRWLSHRTWVTNDRWQYPPPDFTGLVAPTSTQWVNGAAPIFRQAYTMVNGVLSLALMPTPAAATRTFLPFIGALMSNLWMPGGDQRVTGYWELTAAVQQVPGFAFQWTLIDSPYSESVVVRFDIRIFTDANNKQWVVYQDAVNQTTFSVSTDNSFDARQFHFYSFEKTDAALNFYIDRRLVCTADNPGGSFATNALFTYFSTVSADYFGGVLPDPGALPAHARLDTYNIFDARPF